MMMMMMIVTLCSNYSDDDHHHDDCLGHQSHQFGYSCQYGYAAMPVVVMLVIVVLHCG